MNILVIQLAKMGDLVQTTPLLDRIKKKYPEAFLSVLVDSRYGAVTSGFCSVGETILFDLDGIQGVINNSTISFAEKYKFVAGEMLRLGKRSFDIVYNINFSVITALISIFFKNSMIIGYRLDPLTRKHLGENWTKFIFHLMRYRRIMRMNLVDLWAHHEKDGKLSCPRVCFNPDMKVAGDINVLGAGDRSDLVIGIQMGCGGGVRQWPLKYYVKLAIMLVSDMGARIVLLGSREERHIAREFNREWLREKGSAPSSRRVTDLIGKTSIQELALVLKECDLLIGGDTGTLHLAAASGIRVLGLYMGTALCHETGPYGDGHYALQAYTSCSPCNEGRSASCKNRFCLKIIRPEAVSALVSYILKEEGKLEASLQGMIKGDVSTLKQVINLSNDTYGYVRVYRMRQDEWGVKAQPLFPEIVGVTEIMAIAYREVARSLMDSKYQIDTRKLLSELEGLKLCFREGTFKKLGFSAKQLSNLHLICSRCAFMPGLISFYELRNAVKKICEGVDILSPLSGYFEELVFSMGSGEIRSPVAEKISRAMSIPVGQLLHVLSSIISSGSSLELRVQPLSSGLSQLHG